MSINNNTLVPIVVEKEPNGMERSYDIYSRLLKDFIVFVTGAIDMGAANTFIAQLLFLENQDPDRDIKIYVNSPGGEVYAGIAMYDTIKHVKNDIVTINVGLSASAASLLLASGTKGKRYALPNSYAMIHQPIISGGMGGQATDIEIEAKHMVELKHKLAQITADNVGKPVEEVLRDMERDYWMSADETLKYGLIDKIMQPKKK
ncbi:ATP-dependent Clp protease proteolytic subunit [candidate division WWE3 bacterium RIFOXYB1_FULL_43_24]|uniref:ATP-dependent Clp protease proteolytic subunit n=2 Tax=Katanobacteria TaxID=422282 RepID=A0A0G0YMZ1_UNCKA|nr:MAG: ATP-dependent Clp protease proteolytic subunit [candidate division WWE3 bacterium GW2011_GWA1_42_12]KKS38055.1 MAG: ATP-dependent Clp protease proteolytic subunit [candidate division WWE3 bacterium GW2011_GWF1_42_14]KKS40369.1 MAG: ATP-dependent Clp protease proteolytic subunit [candidate division WWE3 bacterium GW2011_GWE1_42_16]OGC61167.1 MAG: ATP-dependent Clp protease proteolytic subunit [candidate division WWE3 bacterium RIFOXYA1_FULL_42_9]OGC69626.1 MAG: ATP-dependent Clp protease